MATLSTNQQIGSNVLPLSNSVAKFEPISAGRQEALAYSAKWLDIVNSKTDPTEAEAKQLIEETVNNFTEHFNRGWVQYRKSVTLSGDFAAVEWKGSGALIQDILGRQFIDCLGGFGLLNYGWSHPDIIGAVRSQLDRTPMPSQELLDTLRGVLARLIALITPGKIKYSFFCASGTEAVEGALKLAKLYTKKNGFISSVNAFHGKTMGSLSVSGKSVFREPVGTLYGGPLYHVPYGDAAAVERQLESCAAIGVGIAAVIMEPVQGEAGAVVPPDDFWPRIRAATKKHGVLLIADEVQTGLGRTGKIFGVEHWGVEPDIICMGKSLGGGVMPVSCFCSTEEIWRVMMDPNPFIHTTTTGGNALACSAAIAAIHVMLRERLWEQAKSKGEFFVGQLRQLQKEFPELLSSITGKGLLLAMHFVDCEIGYKVAAGLFSRGVLVAGMLNSAKSIRLEPPLVIGQELLATVIGKLRETLQDIRESLKKGELSLHVEAPLTSSSSLPAPAPLPLPASAVSITPSPSASTASTKSVTSATPSATPIAPSPIAHPLPLLPPLTASASSTPASLAATPTNGALAHLSTFSLPPSLAVGNTHAPAHAHAHLFAHAHAHLSDEFDMETAASAASSPLSPSLSSATTATVQTSTPSSPVGSVSSPLSLSVSPSVRGSGRRRGLGVSVSARDSEEEEESEDEEEEEKEEKEEEVCAEEEEEELAVPLFSGDEEERDAKRKRKRVSEDDEEKEEEEERVVVRASKRRELVFDSEEERRRVEKDSRVVSLPVAEEESEVE